MTLSRTTWTLTPDAFDALLGYFDADREIAGRKYEVARRKLLEFFEARGSHDPEEHADETFDRVTRKIAEGEVIASINSYCYGVARLLWMEVSRSLCKQPVELDERIALPTSEPDEGSEELRLIVEARLDCLDDCLNKLADETREFIVEYFCEEHGPKIERRRQQAERLRTSLNALRLRASRLRRELGRCTDACVRGKAGSSAS